MFDGYMTFGGIEIANSERLRGYARTAPCPVFAIKSDPCPNLRDALGHDEYTYDLIYQAPWADPSSPASLRFLGVDVISNSIGEPSRSISSTDGIADGQIFTNIRRGGMEGKVRAMLFGLDEEALEYGLSWLAAVLDPNACGSTSEECGLAELEMFASCPSERPSNPEDVAEWERSTLRLRRRLIDSLCISGPLRDDRAPLSNAVSMTVEFTISSERGYLYGAAVDPVVFTSGTFAIDDIARNLVRQPDAELTGTAVTVSRNIVTNPSAETGVASWVGSSTAGSAVTITRQTAQKAVGAYGFQATTTSDASKARTVRSSDFPIPSDAKLIGATIWVKIDAVPSGYSDITLFLVVGNSTVATVTIPNSADALAGVFLSISPRVLPAGATTARIVLVDTVLAETPAKSYSLFFDAASIMVS